MAEKKFIAICLVCIILVTGLVGVSMLLNQKEDEIKIKIEQFVEMGKPKELIGNPGCKKPDRELHAQQ